MTLPLCFITVGLLVDIRKLLDDNISTIMTIVSGSLRGSNVSVLCVSNYVRTKNWMDSTYDLLHLDC